MWYTASINSKESGSTEPVLKLTQLRNFDAAGNALTCRLLGSFNGTLLVYGKRKG